MAMLDLRLLTLKDEIPGKEISDRCIDTRRILHIVRDVYDVQIVEQTRTTTITFSHGPSAVRAFKQIVAVVRLMSADRVRIGEIPGFELSERESDIIRKTDIELIEIVSAGVRMFAQLSVATRSGVRVYVGRDLGTDGEVPTIRALHEAIFCS